MRVDACPEPSQNQGNELLHRIGAGVWRVGFRCVLVRTPPELKQKHGFLQCYQQLININYIIKITTFLFIYTSFIV